jgi:eukaryotic translation initiation factor 2C
VPHRRSTNSRSFRYSSCGLPVLNLDVGYSAFLASGPAIDVIAKIIGMPAVRGRGGYLGGIQPKRELFEMNERDIARAKSKLRGAKVSQLWYTSHVQLMNSSP